MSLTQRLNDAIYQRLKQRRRCPRPQRDEKPGQLYVGCGKFKKFSGLQSKIFKKLFTMKMDSKRQVFGALAFVRLYVRPVPVKVVRKNELGACAPVSFLRLHR